MGRGGSGEKREGPQQKPVDAAQRDISVATGGGSSDNYKGHYTSMTEGIISK